MQYLQSILRLMGNLLTAFVMILALGVFTCYVFVSQHIHHGKDKKKEKQQTGRLEESF